jgi:UDP-N-acetylmuramoylalanine--D-glutamate ligase
LKQRLVILGGGESGAGAALLGLRKGWDVFLSDRGQLKDKYRDELTGWGVAFEEGRHTPELILNADLVIKSPGIPDTAPLIVQLKEKGTPIISEIEFGLRHTDARTIGITGTNGKTTTTLLIYHIFKKAGLNVGLAGNVGTSLARQVAENSFDHYVIELSSFQLDGMFESRINTAILTNITPDHLDRYPGMAEYTASKLRILQNQTADDAFIYCTDDPLTHSAVAGANVVARRYPFSLEAEQAEGAYCTNEELIIKVNNNEFRMNIHELALQGRHNAYNSMAAGIAARVLDIKKDTVRESLSDFVNVEHRLEKVLKVHGIQFINDSKATNINSTWYALECMNTPVVWIVGGVDKGNDYSMVMDLVKQKVKAIVCLGTDNSKIHKAFAGKVPTIIDTISAEEAVRAAYYLGKKGDTVLLSPACASFDLFENYEDRGHRFKAAVRAL